MFKKITVIGSGVMGSAIAAHITNAGCKVNLLDIPDKNHKNKNNIVDQSIKRLKKNKPNSFTLNSNINLIQSGNIEENLNLINESDWVIEAIIENLEIKKELYKKIDSIMKKDLIISSNTSTIPIKLLTKDLSENFKKNFLITHFFNPPRYLKLLEVVKSNLTNNEIFEKIKNFGDINLGKSVIETKDTPGFIGNRIGIFWIERASLEAIKLNLTVEEADFIIQNIFKVPKTGVFGLLDVIGLDLIPPVVESLLNNLPDDDYYKSVHSTPEIFNKMLDKKLIGRKGDGGFYKLVNKNNKKIKYSLNLKSMEHHPSIKPVIPNSNLIKKNIKDFLIQENKYSIYAQKIICELIYYVLEISEEIANDVFSIDESMKNGFGWKYGPFELIDLIGLDFVKKILDQNNKKIPKLLTKVLNDKFYKIIDNKIHYFNFKNKDYEVLNRNKGILLLSDIKKIKKPVSKISSASLWDIGDGVSVFEIHSKSNSIDMATMEFLDQSIDLVSSKFKSMIIYNEGNLFSAGANLGEALFLGNIGLENIVEEKIISYGQKVYTKLKYSNFPVISAPFNMALGGGCEILLHSDFVQAHIELYTGLTEAALGILPAWGGCKELLGRFSDNKKSHKGPMPAVLKTFETIGMAKVSTSAHEAKKIGFLKNTDGITMNRDRLLFDSKQKALELSKDYSPPEQYKYNLPGLTAFTALELGLQNMQLLGQISKHDFHIGKIIANVLSGGNTDILSELSEENILNLEKHAINNLIRNNFTIERLEYVLDTGKYLRN